MPRNRISVPLAIGVGLGSIIGAGIFTLSGTAIALAGADSIIAFILVGIIAMIIAFEVSELVAIMPDERGVTYSYIRKAFGNELGFISGLLLYFSYSTAISVIALGFGSYMSDILGLSIVYRVALSIALIFVVSIVNLIGIRKAARIDSALVITNIAILGIFVAFAIIFSLSTPGFSFVQHLTSTPAQGGIVPIFDASVVIFLAYSGFQTITTFTTNIEGKARGAARAIIFSVLITIIVYVFVVTALITLVPAKLYPINPDPLQFALNYIHAPHSISFIVDIGALIATASTALAMILRVSRMSYQISKDGLLPKIFRKYNSKKDVASSGVIIAAIISVIMIFSGNIYVIASISNFGILFSYLLVSFALIHFRRIGKSGDFKIPFYPYLPIIAIIGIITFIFGMPREALEIGIVAILVLIVVYYMLIEATEAKVNRVRLFK